jgi:uncharacterized protein (TIGR02452 family)
MENNKMTNQNKTNLKKQLGIARDTAISLGRETVAILNAGFYMTPGGNKIKIQESVNESIQGTITYSPEVRLSNGIQLGNQTVIEVKNETTLNAVKRLIAMGYADPVALNFASAESPGGGFLHGALAQEEYLARSSALYFCLVNNPMYRYHQSHLDPFYSDYVIYSPEVVIIRDDDGNLLDMPYKSSIITSPAVHANGVRHYKPEQEKEIEGVMWKRILKVLAAAVEHKHNAIVLGAWGCGAFGNDGNEIAALFKKALEENFRGAFEYVIFAITDWSAEDRFIGPFLQAFNKEKS